MSPLQKLVLPAAAGALLVSCGDDADVKPAPPRPVYTATVAEPTETVIRHFSGQVETAEGAGLAFEVSGRVTEVTAKEGTRYNAGDILAKIDDTSYQNQLTSDKATLDNATAELRRLENLFGTGNASKSDLDNATAQEKSARASFENSQKSVRDCVLKMPYPGVIGSVDIEPQQVISTGQTVMSIQGETGKEFEVGIPAEQIAHIGESMKATIKLGALPDETFDATVSEISPDVDSNGTYPVKLVLGEAANDNETIRAGMDGECALLLPNPKGPAMRIPSPAVVGTSGGETFVWIIEPKEGEKTAAVQKRAVKTGALAGNGEIEIIDGLKPGEVIVTRGVNSLDELQVVALPN
ncbi:MAG: efflux RND transporter periplasmic adaptor subunit [Verrucomicrobiota bacterium]